MLIDKISYNNPMRDINPGIKVLFTVIILVILLSVNNITLYIFNFLLFNVIINKILKVSVKDMIKLYLIPVFFLLTTLFSLLLVSANITIFLGRALAAISVVYALICSTPIIDFDYVFMKVKMPKIFREMFLLVYKYIFILFDVKDKGIKAQKSRLGYKNFRTSMKSFTTLVVSIFNKTTYYSYNSSKALESRLGKEFLFYHRKYRKIGKESIIMLIIIILNVMMVIKNA